MKMFVRFIFISVIFFYSFSTCLFAQNKIKLGLLVPLTGEFSEIGQSIVKSTLLAINKIDNPLIEIIPKDTKSDPEVTYNKAKQVLTIIKNVKFSFPFFQFLEFLKAFETLAAQLDFEPISIIYGT